MSSYEINRNNGFSLIELVIVIGVLGIISMIGIPAYLTVIEKPIASLIKVGNEKQLWKPKSSKGKWFILRLDKIVHKEFNSQLKIKLSLELGDKFLHQKFTEIQKEE